MSENLIGEVENILENFNEPTTTNKSSRWEPLGTSIEIPLLSLARFSIWATWVTRQKTGPVMWDFSLVQIKKPLKTNMESGKLSYLSLFWQQRDTRMKHREIRVAKRGVSTISTSDRLDLHSPVAFWGSIDDSKSWINFQILSVAFLRDSHDQQHSQSQLVKWSWVRVELSWIGSDRV